MKVNNASYTPGVYKILLLLFTIFFLGSCIVLFQSQRQLTGIIAVIIAVISFGFCKVLIYNCFGKYRLVNKIVNLHNWSGNETVLTSIDDFGLCIIRIAGKLSTGSCVGICPFKTPNKAQIFKIVESNAVKESVSPKIILSSQNLFKTDYPLQYFDLIILNVTLNKLNKYIEVEKVFVEMDRILQNGGKIILSDNRFIGEAKIFFSNKNYHIEFFKKNYFTLFGFFDVLIISR